jgi:GAF domain-containing protein
MTKRPSSGVSSPNAFSIERLRADLQELFKRFEVIQQRSQLIRELDRAILKITLSPKEVFDILVRKACEYTESQHAQVVLLHRDHLEIEASTDAARVGKPHPFESLCGKAIREGKQNYRDVSKLPPESYIRFNKTTKSELAIPIKPERTSRVLGVLIFERSLLKPFDEETIDFAELLAGQAAIAIEHARVGKSVDMVQRISSTLLAGEITLGQAFNEILHSLLEALNFEHGQILRRDGSEFLIIGSSRKDDLGLRMGPSNSVCGRYLLAEQKRKNLLIPDIVASEYSSYYLSLLGKGEIPMRSELIVPLVREGRLIGALNLESPQVGAFSEIDEKLLAMVAEPMGHAVFATFGRTSRTQQSQIETANLAMTHLGQVAHNFHHRFGNHIGIVRGSLLDDLKNLVTNEMTEQSTRAQAEALIQSLVARLDRASSVLGEFVRNFNPDGHKFKIQRMDLAKVAKTAVRRFAKTENSIRTVFRNQLPSETSPDGKPVTGKSICELSYQVYDILENFLVNAQDAIRQRQRSESDQGFEGLIEVILDLPDPLYPRLRIIDNGIGISEKIQKKIFAFGSSTKGRTGGGIGLWFCNYYIALRGGRIQFRSVEGEGTVFDIQFPAAFRDS